MSKKPTKISDSDKEWALNKRKDRKIRSKLEYHLIICEGTQTEPNYFKALKEMIKEKDQEKISLKIIGKGRGTNSLLNDAIKEVEKSINYISNVWLIYDKDEFTDESFDEVIEQCQKLNKENDVIYNPIWSNESIETWILLHFIRFNTKMGRKDCIKKINENFAKRKLGKYQKNDIKIYEKLKPYQSEAIRNAKWLEKNYVETMLPSEMNPCTKIHKLVELLNKYIDN